MIFNRKDGHLNMKLAVRVLTPLQHWFQLQDLRLRGHERENQSRQRLVFVTRSFPAPACLRKRECFHGDAVGLQLEIEILEELLESVLEGIDACPGEQRADHTDSNVPLFIKIYPNQSQNSRKTVANQP